MNVRSFDPVYLAEDSRVRQGIVSQTFLKHFDGCRRAAYLYDTVRVPASVHMDRGSALHVVVERCIRLAREHGEKTVPPEVAKAELDAVITQMDVPISEQDYLREMVYRWASEFDVPEVDDDRLVVEGLFELEVGGLTVRCRIDYAVLSEDGTRLEVKDWKSAKGMPSQDDVARKRPDGTYSAKAFQLVLYALALVFGRPVVREKCEACNGLGMERSGAYTFDGEPLYAGETECPACGPAGYVERVEALPFAPRAQHVHLAYVYPGIEDRDGLMAKREVSLTPLELHEYLSGFEAMGDRVRQAVADGDWPARPGAHCSECPAPLRCPIPPDLRAYQADGAVAAAGYVNSAEDASARAALLDRAKATVAAWEKELKAWSKANGGQPIPFGRDVEFAWVPVTSETIPDKAAMILAMERAVQYGGDFDPRRFVQVRTGTRWTRRTRAEAS